MDHVFKKKWIQKLKRIADEKKVISFDFSQQKNNL